MTKTNYRRRLDARGRLTIPTRFRLEFDFKSGDDFEFFYENDLIIIRKKCNSKLTPAELNPERK